MELRPPLLLDVVAIGKGAFGSPSTKGRQLYLHIISIREGLGKYMATHYSSIYPGGCPRGVMVKAMDCGIVVREFVLQSRYYVHFQANTLGKGMNPLILPAIG